MRYLLIAVMAVHGLIHMMGFAKAFGYAEVSQLKQPIPAPAGILWLAGALSFLAAAGLYVARVDSWYWAALAAIALSQALIFAWWSDARFGTVANLIVLLGALPAALEARPASFRNRYDAVVRESLARVQESGNGPVSESDFASLPEIVQRYLLTVGAVGRPKLTDVRIVFKGEFRNGLNAPAMSFDSEQVNTFNPATRAFLMRAKMYGLPMAGFHLFRDGKATMRIQLGSALQVVDAHGPQMDRSETVTFFNDLCLFAPAALIGGGRIQWERGDGPLSARAAFTHRDDTIRARLYFNAGGELVDFVSEDRYFSSDGKTYRSYPWSTPVLEYKEVDGRRVPARAEAVWHMPEGKFVYGKFNLVEIRYNGDPGGR